MTFNVQPVTLTGKLVRLEPLRVEHAGELLEIAQDPDIWTYMPVDPSVSLAAMQRWLDGALRNQEAGIDLPFIIRDRASGRALGSTRYLNITPHDRGLEIGSTWLCASARRTGVNTECKYLLLRHAFETLGAIRVQLKTDSRNLRSQRAIERIGGVREGVLRNHMILPDGYYRDSVYYSIIEREWPRVKENLLVKMKESAG
jgi:RimJ/RimL family protein N-acetyltransferase